MQAEAEDPTDAWVWFVGECVYGSGSVSGGRVQYEVVKPTLPPYQGTLGK